MGQTVGKPMPDNDPNLLAAAGDLYESLEILLDHIDCFCDAYNGTGKCPVHRAQEALAKARGEQQVA